MQTQRVRALQTIVGAYPCAAADSDFIQKELTEDANGNIVSKRVAYKRVVAKIETVRQPTPGDIKDDAARVERDMESRLSEDGQWLTVPADPEFLDLPKSYADKLIKRGLAAPVTSLKGKNSDG